MIAYLDNAATTRVCDEAAAACMKAMTECYGNPSSLHRMGLDAELLVTDARKTIAGAMGAQPEQIVFTSGATEANNTLIMGAAKAYGRRRRTIVASAVEHPSVAETLKALENEGFKVKRIGVLPDGTVDADAFIDAVNDETLLATCMYVNNETGAIMPVDRIFSAIKYRYPECITHTDAVQGFMKYPVKVSALHTDLVTVSGHKIQAPKGVGAMYIRKGIRIPPRNIGGGQERGQRSGTEAVPLIAAFGAAVKAQCGSMDTALSNARALNDHLRGKLSTLPYVHINSDENCSPYILNFSVEGVRSEIMLHFLETKNVFVSSGSACSKGVKSGVLAAMGLPDKLGDSALRISFCRTSSWGETDQLFNALREGYMSVAHVNG